jgi:hypothetical protein
MIIVQLCHKLERRMREKERRVRCMDRGDQPGRTRRIGDGGEVHECGWVVGECGGSLYGGELIVWIPRLGK